MSVQNLSQTLSPSQSSVKKTQNSEARLQKEGDTDKSSIIDKNPLNLTVRSLDGSGNNPFDSDLGQAGQPYARVAKANYADGISEPIAGPNSRSVSNRIFNDINQNLFSENNVSQLAGYWGQFLDHTFGLREGGEDNAPILFDENDPLEEFQNDFGVIRFQRSAAAPGTSKDSPREQTNIISSYIDGWAIYGGSEDRLEWLREGPVDGDLSNNKAHLILDQQGYLPRSDQRGDTSQAPTMDVNGRLITTPDKAFVSGDVRANENIGLSAIHTLFVREHNRIVDELPNTLDEETKFQIARKVVGATQQYITYEEFLPTLGIELPEYKGYDPKVDPSITNEFSTVGFRAHSMLHGEIELEGSLDEYTPEQLKQFESMGIEIEVADSQVNLAVPLNVAYFNPDLLTNLGLEEVLEAFSAEAQYKNDEQIDNQLRSILFQIPKNTDGDLDGPNLSDSFTTVADLGALDIERARDHGIPLYNDLREAYGLERVDSFTDITGENTENLPNGLDFDNPDSLLFGGLFDLEGNSVAPGEDAVVGIRNTTTAARLKAIYGDVDQVDAFVGMVSEKHLQGSEFGELQNAIWTEQFEDLRDGDRFFYLNDPDLTRIANQYGISYQRTLGEVMVDNTELTADRLPSNVFQIETVV